MFAAAAFHQQQHQLQQSEYDYPEVCSQPITVNTPYTPQQLAPNLESINPQPSPLYPTEKIIEPQATPIYTFSPEQAHHSSSAHPLGNLNANCPLATQSMPIVVYPPKKIPYVDSQPGVYLPEKPRYVDPQEEIYLPEKPQFSLISQPQQPSYPPSISSGKDNYGIPPPPPYTPQAPICGPDANVYPQQAFQISQANQTQVDELQPLVYIPPEKATDEKKSGTAKRFLGDTLVGRFARKWNIPVCVSQVLIDDQEVRYIQQLAQRDCIHIFHLGEIIIGIDPSTLIGPLKAVTDSHHLVSLYQMSGIGMLPSLQPSPSLGVRCLKYVTHNLHEGHYILW